MRLLTDEIREQLPPLGKQEAVHDPMVYVKFFTPDAGWTWYATEGSPDTEDDFTFFGWVEGLEQEWGYFSLRELMSVRGKLGLPVERDLHFSPRPISEVNARAVSFRPVEPEATTN